jgi:hypothetical protein
VFQTCGIRTAVRFDLTADTLEFGLVAPGDRHMGTEGGQLMGRATPDTAAAGDDDDVVTKQVATARQWRSEFVVTRSASRRSRNSCLRSTISGLLMVE